MSDLSGGFTEKWGRFLLDSRILVRDFEIVEPEVKSEQSEQSISISLYYIKVCWYLAVRFMYTQNYI